MAEDKNIQNNEDDKEKKNKGAVIGVITFAAAAAIAVPLGLQAFNGSGNSLTVTLLSDDEVSNFTEANIDIAAGAKIGDLKNSLTPVDGYKIAGFYKDEACTDPYDDEDVVTEDAKIFIRYEEIQIKLIFHNEENPEDNNFETMTVGYFDKLPRLKYPSVSNYETKNYIYSFKNWETLDRQKVDFLSLTTGKELLEIDADGEIDLYATFNSEYRYSYLVFNAEHTKIIGITNKDITELVIPDEYLDGTKITEIGSNAFYSCGKLTSVTIGNNITSIGDYAFQYCSSLKSVVIGDNVTSLGKYLFSSCTNLESIIIGKGVKSFGSGAFNYCNSLSYVNFLGTIDDWASIDRPDSSARPSGRLYIQGELLTNAVINATKINFYAFAFCQDLVSVTIGEGVETIEAMPFTGCRNLKKVTIGKNVTSIGNGAFENCGSLESVIVDAANTTYTSRDLSGKEINCIVDISAKKLVVGSNTVTIPTDAEFVTSIGSYAFCGMNIKEIIIPENITSIGDYAFERCPYLVSITIGKNVKSIGRMAFYNSNKLAEVINLSSLNIIAGSDSYGYVAAYAVIVHSDTESKLQTIDGVYYLTSGKDFIALGLADKSLTSIKLSDQTTKIKGYAFYECANLKSVIIPEGVKEIGIYAFFNCGLESIVIPNSVTVLESYVFYNSLNLVSVTLGTGIKSIPYYAFDYCKSLTSIVIPNSVKSIDSSAFYACDNLEIVYYTGTETEWSKITIGSSNTQLTRAATIKCFYSANKPESEGNYWHWTEVDGVQTPTVWKED